MHDIFNFYPQPSPVQPFENGIQKDLRLVNQFFIDLPAGLGYFTFNPDCNLLQTLMETNSEPVWVNYPALYQQAYQESFNDYEYFLAEIEQKITSKEASVPIELHRALKKIGMTGSSLNLKIEVLKNWWNKLKQKLSGSALNFKIPKVRSIFKKLMAHLNSILGSLAHVFAILEPIKEFKEMLESGNDLIEEAVS